MGLRSRTKFVMKVKSRRCSKCGGKLGRHDVRCRRCHQPQRRPAK